MDSSNFASDWLIKKVGAWLSKKIEPKRSYLSDFDYISEHVHACDVILVSGRRRVSHIIRNITQSPWSHAALYIGRLRDIEDEAVVARIRAYYDGDDDSQIMIESELGQGTFISRLSDFREEHIRIARPSSLTPDDAKKVIAHATLSLGRQYSVRHVLDLMRFLFPWSILPRRWRSSLFSHNALKPTEDICSYMIANAFAQVNYPILPLVEYDSDRGYELTRRNPKLFTPSDFDYSPYFDIIKYPIFGPTNKVPYHNLPWKHGVMSHHKPRGQR